MKNGANPASPMSRIEYCEFFPRRLSAKPAQVLPTESIKSLRKPTESVNRNSTLNARNFLQNQPKRQNENCCDIREFGDIAPTSCNRAALRFSGSLRNEFKRSRGKNSRRSQRDQITSAGDPRRRAKKHRERRRYGRGGLVTRVWKVQDQSFAGAGRPQPGQRREDQDRRFEEAYLFPREGRKRFFERVDGAPPRREAFARPQER